MAESLTESPSSNLDATFIEQVQQALDRLYDFPYLQHHPLTRQLQNGGGLSAESAGQRLRRDLVTAIESLNPGPNIAFRSPIARAYSMLQLHYVEGLTVLEAAHKLSISARQAHRELRHGEESVAEMLWMLLHPLAPAAPADDGRSSLQAEIARLGNEPHTADARQLLAHAHKTVAKLAESCGVKLALQTPSYPVIISADLIAAQQFMVSLLSHAVRQAQPSNLQVQLHVVDDVLELSVSFSELPAGAASRELAPVVRELATRLGWRIKQREMPPGDDGMRELTVCMPTLRHTLLVIDDNEGLTALVERYLSGEPYRVVKALSGLEGLQLAQEIVPAAIILDIMLPKIDGWEVLQRLRSDPRMSHIPVIVCSVIHEPELAKSLGASLMLSKPVSRDELLNALQMVSIT